MTHSSSAQRFDTVVVGGGQAGLAVGHYLAEQGRDFVILDAAVRVGDCGEDVGTRCVCSPRPATTDFRACPSRNWAATTQPRTRWPTIWRRTPAASTSRWGSA